jgi:hypothetical protein
MCSNVIHDGSLTRPVDVAPSWLYANMTSGKTGTSHFTWCACHHASPIGPTMPVGDNDRSLTEAKWELEAWRLFDLRTANWKVAEKERFGRILGFVTGTPEEKSA